MRKIILLLVLLPTANAFAAPVEPLNDVSRHIAAYLPYVRMLIYILAVLTGMAGGVMVAFIKMQNEDANVKTRIVATAASCLMLIAAATALPQFFGYEADGSAGSRIAGNYKSGGVQTYDEISGDYIKTEIPGLDSDKWITFPDGTNKNAIKRALDIWENNYQPGISKNNLHDCMTQDLMEMMANDEIGIQDFIQTLDCFQYILKNRD